MKAAISINHAAHQAEHGEAMRAGLARHGIASVFTRGDRPVESVDFHVTWSVKRPQTFAWARRTGRRVLVMERGHIQPRTEWTSIGWDGLAGRGRYPKVDDGGARWRAHFGHLLQDWRRQTPERALLIGQVRGDASLYGLAGGFERWAQEATDALRGRGVDVVYRTHPLMLRNGDHFCPTGATLSGAKELTDDLGSVGLCVSYNSTAGVEAVLYGCPGITMDEGSMAWPVTAHDLSAEPPRPDRTAWCHALAWTQWRLDEISSGAAWEVVRNA